MRSSDLGLEPLCELHGDVHVGQTEARVVQAVTVHCPTDFISVKKTLNEMNLNITSPDHVLPPILLCHGQ